MGAATPRRPQPALFRVSLNHKGRRGSSHDADQCTPRNGTCWDVGETAPRCTLAHTLDHCLCERRCDLHSASIHGPQLVKHRNSAKKIGCVPFFCFLIAVCSCAGKWIQCTVTNVEMGGGVQLDVKPGVWIFKEEQPGRIRVPQTGPYSVGDQLEYNSASQGRWMCCVGVLLWIQMLGQV